MRVRGTLHHSLSLAGIWILTVEMAPAQSPVSFHRQVRPILEQRCRTCHAAEGGQASLSLASYKDLQDGGRSGPVVVPGSPEESLLIRQISGEPPAMPQVGDPLDAIKVELISRWIAEGAKDDTPAARGTESHKWWSLRPLERPPLPEEDSNWIRTPIDSFILSRLKKQGLTPSPEADRRTLIRRLSYDLHGLPPTPHEIDAFVNDPSADAYEKLVERLLASPRYGERWGRHWLDVVHYGESHGYDKDKPRRNAWPYRDYVIRSLNEDKSYSRFVEEQLAGDVLFPDDPQGVVATGFIAAGPWDYVGHKELREGTKDKKIARLLDRDDMVTATMSTFVSLTAHCARCHDHKFDPIRQEDYYSLQAVFAGVDRADRPYDLDPETYRQRRGVLKQKRDIEAGIQPVSDALAKLSSPEIEALDEQMDLLQDRRDYLNHSKTAGKTTEERAENKVLDEQIQAADEKLHKAKERRRKMTHALLDEADQRKLAALREQLVRVQETLAEFPKPRIVYAAANYFETNGNFRPAWTPRPVHLLDRGSVEAPVKLMGPGAVSAVESLSSRFKIDDPNDEGARRAALSKWIIDARNPLTWRSIVNRIWHYHFGKGIVETPNDFGRMGSQPTHPQLLDRLAVEFQDNGGSFKNLHRLILTSAVYRQSSRENPRYAKIDSDNRYLWRMNRLRLDAESVRDSVLSITGKLDLNMGGPSVEQFFFKDDHSPVYDYTRFDLDSPASYRRSIYRFLVRSTPDPFMESLDCPDPSLLTPKRNSTLTAIQALALLNDPLIVKQAEHFAARLRKAGNDLPNQIQEAYLLALGRVPRTDESRMLAAYARTHGLENLCRLIFNSNEFMFVD